MRYTNIVYIFAEVSNKSFVIMQVKVSYLPPKVGVIQFFIEQGFANSLENPFENPEIDW